MNAHVPRTDIKLEPRGDRMIQLRMWDQNKRSAWDLRTEVGNERVQV